MISPEQFFSLLVGELEANPALQQYYRVLEDPSRLEFRKSYLIARWRYVLDQVSKSGRAPADMRIWDFGCGYGTTALFLVLNGHSVHGSTLEYYYDAIGDRKRYWSRFGDVDRFTVSYENLFDAEVPRNAYDVVIVQDTLHHLEPIDQGLRVLRDALTPGGRILVIEENGHNLIQNAILFLRRGNKRIITIRDERLGKDIVIGNENIRSFAAWKALFQRNGLRVDDNSLQNIRFLLPAFCRKLTASAIFEQEQSIARKYAWLREYFFFGINFVATRG